MCEVWVGMYYSLIIMLTKSGLFSKKCWMMQYPSLFNGGKGELDKTIMVDKRYRRGQEVEAMAIAMEVEARIQRTVILITTIRWP